MPLELFPIQLPTTAEGCARTPLILLLDGSGFAFEYTNLLPLDRLVYGVSVSLPGHHAKRPNKTECEEHLAGDFGTLDDYLDSLVRLIEDEVLSAQEADTDEEDDEIIERQARPAPEKRTPALHIGGFSFGGFLAIELTRRLTIQTRTEHLHIASIILLDSYNPSAPQIRTAHEQLIRGDDPRTRSNLTDYPENHPQLTFMSTHMLHSLKLMSEWTFRPLVPENGQLQIMPPVYFLRAATGCVTDPAERMGYWTRDILPTLVLGKVKVVENSDHLGIWKPGRVEVVTEWLEQILQLDGSS